jgi:hypothetical protein
MHDETTPPLSRTPWHERTVLNVQLWDDGETSIEAHRPLPGQTILCITNDGQQWEVNLRCHGPRILGLLMQAVALLGAEPTVNAEQMLPLNEQPVPSGAPLDPKRPIGVGRSRKQ